MDNKKDETEYEWTPAMEEDYQRWLSGLGPFDDSFDELEFLSDLDLTPDAIRPKYLC